MRLPAWLLVFALFAASCGGSSIVQQGPSDTLRAYARALDEGRAEDAYRLLSDDAKRSLSLEAFRRAVKDNPEEIREISRALVRPASDPVVTATVSMPNGDELLLVFEEGKWRIDAAAIDLYSQATPRQTLVGFLRAFERKRYDVLLRYVPAAEIEGLPEEEGFGEATAAPEKAAPEKPAPEKSAPKTLELTAEKLKTSWEGPQKEQINRIVQAIRTSLPTAVIEETGDSASMSYGAGGTVALVREHGLWRIRDF